MKNYNERMLSEFKTIISEFICEMKTNSVTDLVVWLDCRLELIEKKDQEMRPK